MSLESCLVSLDFDEYDANELRQLAMRAGDDVSAVEQYIEELRQDEQTLRDQLTKQGIDAQVRTVEQAVEAVQESVEAASESAEAGESRVEREVPALSPAPNEYDIDQVVSDILAILEPEGIEAKDLTVLSPLVLDEVSKRLKQDIEVVAPILYQRYDMPDSEADGQRNDGTHPFQMSTRVPSAKATAGQAEQAVYDGQPLLIGVEHVLQLPPEQLKKMASALKLHAGFKTSSRKPEKVIEEHIEHVKDNLMWLHNLVAEQYPDLIERSHQWYDGARRITTEWAKIYGVPDRSVAAVLAALSPQMDWFKNVTLAQRVLDIHTHLTTGNAVAMPPLDSMKAWADAKYAPRKKPANWDKKSAKRKAEWERDERNNALKLAQYRELFAGDKTYSDLPEGQNGDIERAMWLRAYDEAENPRTYRLVTPEGAFGDLATNNDGTPARATWGTFREIAKAISAVRDPSVEGISAFIGGEHKVRNFYNNILTPNSPFGEVTIDTHAVAAALMLPLGGSDLEVAQNFGGGGAPSSNVTGSQGIYGILAEAYRRAAADPGIDRLPRQIQSITWEAIRSIFIPAFKNKANKAAVKAVWAQYERGAISKDAARSQILEMAGGLRAPEWATSDDARNTATDPSRLASYDGELAGLNIRSRQHAEGFGFGDVSSADGDTVGIGPQIRGTLFQRDSAGPEAAGERPDSDRFGREGVADALVSAKQGAVRLTGQNGRSRLKGLEQGSPGAVPGLREAAADYARQAGIEHDHQAEYARVDIERAQRIAQAYEDMEHAPNDPAVQASYNAMIRETLAQYEYILELGYTFTPIVEGFENPYPTVKEALEDLSVNKHLWFFPTDFGYGTSEEGAPALIPQSQIAENPLLAFTDYEINGQRLRANDVFRIVHDVFGHGVEGSLFRARGEENAWQAHIRLYSDEAAGAVTTETRGQNSWVNYGPTGEANRTALTEDTVFAEQKIGLMPEWTWQEGRSINEKEAKQSYQERKAILEANAAIEGTAPAPVTRREQAVFNLRRRFIDARSGRIRGVTGGRSRDGENGRLVANGRIVSAYTQAGYSAPAVGETDAATFVKLIEQSKAESKFGAAVYVYPESAYENMQLWVTDDGKAGFAIKPDGDIVSVFNLQGSPHKGVVPYFLSLAVHQGGTKLDAFDTILPYLYAASGFVEVGRDTWSEEYKPDGWDYKTFGGFNYGRPDVVYMEYQNAEQPYRSDAELTRTLFQSPTPAQPDQLDATDFFKPEDVEAFPAHKARDRVISMAIDDFLAMAAPGEDAQKTSRVAEMLAAGQKFEVPFLSIDVGRDKQANVTGHEGRHRARALKDMGYTTMPVRLRTDVIRWSEQREGDFDYIEVWPETLLSEKGRNVIPFPVSRENAVAEYVAGSATQSEMRQAAQTETREFKAWFGDSKVVDESGEPLVVYHGSTRPDVDRADISQANVENFFGKAFYASDSTEDVGSYYATQEGPDLQSKIYQAAEQLEVDAQRIYGWEDMPKFRQWMLDTKVRNADGSLIPAAQRDPVIREESNEGFEIDPDNPELTVEPNEVPFDWWEAFAATQVGGDAPNISPVYFSLQNPADLRRDSEAVLTVDVIPDIDRVDESEIDERLSERFDEDEMSLLNAEDLQEFREFVAKEIAIEQGDFEIEGTLAEFIQELETAAFDLAYNADREANISTTMQNEFGLGLEGVGLYDAVMFAKQAEDTGIPFLVDENANFIGNEVVRLALERMGYDGIIHTAEFSGMPDSRGATHYLAFRPNQVKSAVGNVGAFDPQDPRFLYQEAFHGTPHTVDAFSLQKIGTGEGAQAFGWGLYFAEDREVAEDYQRTLAQRGWQPDPNAQEAEPEQLAYQIDQLYYASGLKFASDKLDKLLDDAVETIYVVTGAGGYGATLYRLSDNSAVLFNEDGGPPDTYRNFDDVKPPTGNLYTVDIADGAVENMLDWDAPLSEQPQSVKQALKNILPELVSTKLANGLYGLGFLKPDGSARNIIGIQAETAEEARKQFTGSEAYKHIQNKIAKEAGFTGSDKAASEALNAAGIPGVKYFDRSSRAAGEGTRNFVVWDEDAITMLEENGQPVADQKKSAILNQPAEVAQPSTAVETDPLGATEFQPEKTTIFLFQNADKSTFLHETGHVFVELLERMALAENAPQRIKDNYAAMLKLVGAESAYDMDYTDPAKTQEERDAARDRQELLARSFEKYLMEGKAPSAALRSAFSMFRRWLTFIYTRLRKLGTTLSPEINDVFDKMLATDEELQIMRQSSGMNANASPTIVAMMDPKNQAKFMAVQEEAEELDRQRLLLLDAELEQAEKEAEWQAAYEAERAQVAAELWAMPQYKAWLFLTGGTLAPEPDAPIQQVKMRQRLQGQRLSKKALVEAGFTPQDLANIPRGPRGRAVYAIDGVNADVLAEALGYQDGASLIAAMRDLAPPQEIIDNEATQRVRQKLGDPANDGTRERLAKENLYHGARQKVILSELNALAESLGKPKTTQDLARVMADEIISFTPIAELLSPLKYEAASVRHAQEAERRAAAGDLLGAYESKQKHLLNHQLFRKTLKLRDEANKTRKQLRKLQTQKIDPKKIAPEYIGQIKTLLNIFGLKESPKQWQAAGQITPEMRALATGVMSWIDAKQAQGEALSVPGELISIGDFDENGVQPKAFMLKHWSEMTTSEFAALKALTKMLENLGRRNAEASKAQRMLRNMQLAQHIRNATNAKPRRKIKDGRIPTAKEESESAKKKWFQASHRKLESLVRQLENFQDMGPLWQALFRPLQDGEDVKAELSRKIVQGVDKIFSVYNLDQRRRMRSAGSSWYSSNLAFGSAKKVPGINSNVTLTHEERLAIALNSGNESSRQALLDDKQLKDLFTPRDSNGNAIGKSEWGESALQAVLDMLSAKDRKVVQEIFDLVDSFWEDVYDDNGNLVTIGIKNLEKQESGLAPPKVKALPFLSNGKVIKGGYYPLKYNPHASEQVAREGEMNIENALVGGYPGSAMTAHNHTIARKGSGGRPIRLGLDVLMDHFEQVTHDLAFRQAVVNADNILTDSAVSDAIKDAIGESGLREMRRTVITVAQGRAAPITPAGQFARSVRMKAANAIMALNLKSILSTPLGLLQSISVLGPTYMTRGLIQWYLSGSKPGSHLLSLRVPGYSMYDNARQVFAKSLFMRNRARVATRELNEVQNKIEFDISGSLGKSAQKAGFAPMLFLDVYSVSMPTWLGAYEKAMAGKVKNVAEGDESNAIAYADSVVRRSQGTGGNLNLSNIQSLDELSKLVTMFGSYFNTTYNLQAEAFNKIRQSQGVTETATNVAAFLYHSTLLTLIPGAFGAILLESFTEEDEENMSYSEWLALQTLLYATGQVFFIRDVASGIASGFKPSFTPAESVFSAIATGGQEVFGMLTDEDYEMTTREAKAIARAVGYAKGVPGTNQIIKSTDWLYKYVEGDLEHPVEDIWTPEGMKRVLFTGDR